MPCVSSHQQEVGGDSSPGVILRDHSLGLGPLSCPLRFFSGIIIVIKTARTIAGVGGGEGKLCRPNRV